MPWSSWEPALRQAYAAFRRVERYIKGILTVSPRTHRDVETAQSSKGFQPVSGRAARHPRKPVIHGPARSRRPIRRAVACSGHRHLHVDQTTGWKPMLLYAVASSRGFRGDGLS
jgi:hypothetical protein